MPLVLHLGIKLANAFNLSPDSDEMAKFRLRFREIGQKHLDLSVTMGKQKIATLDGIEQELKATFSEFHDADLGGLRLELSMAYIQTYWGEQRSLAKRKGQVEDETKDGKSPTNENTDDEYADDDDKSSALKGAVSVDFNFTGAPIIKEFLESFAPSLLYLYLTFMQAGITGQAQLDSLASWPRFNLVEFLGGLEDPVAEKGKKPGQGKLKKVVVEALVLRLKASNYE